MGEHRWEPSLYGAKTSWTMEPDMVGPAIIDWLNPHLYGAGPLIVVYLGNKPTAVGTLEELLGPQFSPR